MSPIWYRSSIIIITIRIFFWMIWKPLFSCMNHFTIRPNIYTPSIWFHICYIQSQRSTIIDSPDSPHHAHSDHYKLLDYFYSTHKGSVSFHNRCLPTWICQLPDYRTSPLGNTGWSPGHTAPHWTGSGYGHPHGLWHFHQMHHNSSNYVFFGHLPYL